MKTQICLYIEGETKSLALSQGINLSKSFQEFLNIQLSKNYKGDDKNKIIENLKQQIIEISQELKITKEELAKLKKKPKYIETGVRF